MVEQITPAPPTPRRARRARGTSFPELRLNRAADYVSVAGQQGRNQSNSTMAGYLGHTTTESGPFKAKMAALRDFGLITGTGDAIVITDDGMEIAHADDPERAAAARRRAFLRCGVFRRAYDDSAKGRPIAVTNIGSRAVLTYGVVGAVRDRFVQAFIDSAVDAGLAERRGDQVVMRAQGDQVLTDHEPEAGDGLPPQSGAGPIDSETATQDHGTRRGDARPVVLNQSFAFDGGSVDLLIRSSRTLPVAAYREIAKVVEAASVLVDVLGVVPAPPASHEDEDAPEQELD